MKNTIFCRLGLAFLALSLMSAGCKYPIEIFVNLPEETPIETPEGGGDSEDIPEDDPKERPLEITGFAFTPVNPLRANYSVKGKTAGWLSDPIGGTAPFTYALASGNGISYADNANFSVLGNLLKIEADSLAVGVYFICLKVTDSKGISYSQAATVTVVPDPVALDQETRIAQGTHFKMCYVPSGTFIKPDYVDIEVSIPVGFWIAETEVTQELYQLIMGENPSHFMDYQAAGEIQNRRPVESVNWYEAALFCNRLSMATGREPMYHVWGVSDWEGYLKWAISSNSSAAIANIYVDEKADGYRLPTVNEWVWAAMGANVKTGQVNTDGAKKHYSGGSVASNVGIEKFAWCRSISSDITHEVGKKQSNELGIFDMTGNVWEWTEYENKGWMGASIGQDMTYAGSSYLFYTFETELFKRNSGVGFRIVSDQ